MKKILAISASAILAAATFAFSACGDGDKGTIKGDYKEATAEEVQTALDGVEEEKIFGSLNGIQLGAKLDFSSSSDETASSASINLDYKLAFGDEVLGSGSFGFKANEDGEQEELTATAYIDGKYAYATLGGNFSDENNENQEIKAKINYGTLLEGIADYLPSADGTDASGNISAEETLNIAEILALVKEYDLGLAMDDTDGVKLKISVTQETVWTILEEKISAATVAEYKNAVTFNTFVFDVYFAIDSANAFGGLGVKIDIDAKINTPSSAVQSASETAIKISGYAEVKAFTGAVNIPDGIAQDGSYVDMTLYVKQILGNII